MELREFGRRQQQQQQQQRRRCRSESSSCGSEEGERERRRVPRWCCNIHHNNNNNTRAMLAMCVASLSLLVSVSSMAAATIQQQQQQHSRDYPYNDCGRPRGEARHSAPSCYYAWTMDESVQVARDWEYIRGDLMWTFDDVIVWRDKAARESMHDLLEFVREWKREWVRCHGGERDFDRWLASSVRDMCDTRGRERDIVEWSEREMGEKERTMTGRVERVEERASALDKRIDGVVETVRSSTESLSRRVSNTSAELAHESTVRAGETTALDKRVDRALERVGWLSDLATHTQSQTDEARERMRGVEESMRRLASNFTEERGRVSLAIDTGMRETRKYCEDLSARGNVSAELMELRSTNAELTHRVDVLENLVHTLTTTTTTTTRRPTAAAAAVVVDSRVDVLWKFYEYVMARDLYGMLPDEPTISSKSRRYLYDFFVLLRDVFVGKNNK